MLDDLDSGKEIARHTEALLRRADAGGRLPTPIGDIVAAAKLVEPEESLLSESALADVPEYLAAKMRRLQGKVHAVLDRKTREIHVDPTIGHEGQRRFKRCHETVHDLLPWQKELAFADNHLTLSPRTQSLYEQEANQGGAELLFQRNVFTEMASDYKVGFAAVTELAEKFGASYHATFRRYVETHRAPIAGMVLDPSPCVTAPLTYRRNEGLNSRAWTDHYERMDTWPRRICSEPFEFVTGIRTLQDVAVASALPYPDLNGEPTTLNVELWSNTYRVFVLIWVPQRERLKRKRIIVPSRRAA